MENCTIYSHKLDFDSIVEYIRKEFPKAKLTLDKNGIRKSIEVEIKGGLFKKSQSLTINYRERETPSYMLEEAKCGLTQNLTGMSDYVKSLSTDNTKIKEIFLKKLQSANCEMAFIVKPILSAELKILLRKIVRHLDGFIFANPGKNFQKSDVQHFLDKNLRLILDANGNSEIHELDVIIESKYHDQPVEEYMQDQLIRKASSEKELEKLGLKINRNLPVIVSAVYVGLRERSDIIKRIYALLAIGLNGEGMDKPSLDKVISDREIQFTEKENRLISKQELSDHEQVISTWRYEALYCLLWAVGQYDQIKSPDEICDVPDIVKKIVSVTQDEFESRCIVRSKIEILNELDKIYRMHWACVDANLNQQDISAIIHPGIIYERHYALNWLVRDKDKSWDDVEVNT